MDPAQGANCQQDSAGPKSVPQTRKPWAESLAEEARRDERRRPWKHLYRTPSSGSDASSHATTESQEDMWKMDMEAFDGAKTN